MTKKLVYITHSHAAGGGMERVISNKANYLVNRGYEVYILTHSSIDIVPFFHYDPKVKFVQIHAGLKKDSLDEYLAEMKGYFDDIQPDVIISTGELNARYIYKIATSGKKVLEDHFAKYRRKYWLRKIENIPGSKLLINRIIRINDAIAKKYDKFVVLTNEDKKSWKYLDHIEVIPNPLFESGEEKSTTENKRVIAVGRFVSQKGFDMLIKAWKVVKQKHPDWVLDIFGSGAREPELQRLITNYKLDDVVNLHKPSKNISKEYLNSSILALTSRHEGQGLVILEAMSHGLPVVAFTCKCGPRDIITDGEDGLLVDFMNIKQFAKKLCIIIENDELRKKMGNNAREKVKKYHVDTIMQQWVDFFQKITTEQKI